MNQKRDDTRASASPTMLDIVRTAARESGVLTFHGGELFFGRRAGESAESVIGVMACLLEAALPDRVPVAVVKYQRRVVLAGEPVTDWYDEPAACVRTDMKIPTVQVRALGVVPMVLPDEDIDESQ